MRGELLVFGHPFGGADGTPETGTRLWSVFAMVNVGSYPALRAGSA